MSRMTVCALCGCLYALLVPLIVQALTIEDVLAGIKDVEAAIRVLSVESKAEILQRSSTHPETMVELSSHQKVIVEFGGQTWVESEGQSYRVGDDGVVVIRPRKAIGTFNGDACRVAYGSSKLVFGMITTVRNDLSLTMDPRRMTTHYVDKPVSQLITKRRGQIVGRIRHDEREAIVVGTEPHFNKNYFKLRFWIAPSLGFAVVKRASMIRFPGHDRWIEFARIVGSDHREIEPGIWLPMRAVYESFGVKEEHARDATEPPLSMRYKIVNSNWIVNPQVDDSLFTLEFPPGIQVEDQTRDRQP